MRKPRSDARVLEWLDELDEDHAFISVVTIAEIRRGIALLATRNTKDFEGFDIAITDPSIA